MVKVAPYLWANSLDGNATVKGIKADVDVGFSDLIKDLAGMLLADVQKGRFGVAVNGVFARVSPKNDVGPFRIKATSDTLQLGVAPYYRVVDWSYRTSSSGKPLRLIVEPEAGFRVTYLRVEVTCATAARLSTTTRAGSIPSSARASGSICRTTGS